MRTAAGVTSSDHFSLCHRLAYEPQTSTPQLQLQLLPRDFFAKLSSRCCRLAIVIVVEAAARVRLHFSIIADSHCQSMAIAAPDDHFAAAPLSSIAPGVFRVLFHDSVLAAKVQDLEQLTDAEFDNLVRGVRLSRSLRHQNLLPFVTAFLQHSRIWSLSPYCDLRSASDLCKPYGLREVLVCVIMRDTLLGLEYLHDRGIIHRAVCGSHILLKSEGRCLLTGFNYATNVVKNGLWRTSLHDFPHGAKKNLIFLAPEILEQNLLGYNQKSDMYSVGVTCCELANGVAPYWNLEPAEMLLDKLTGNHAKPIDCSCTQYIRVPGGQ
jgi:serine/threonine protein kinase